MKYLVIIIFCILSTCFTTQAQSVNWTSFEHLGDSLRTERKPLLIFIHTDWCKYCEMQENLTFEDNPLAAILNKDYYCLKINAESKDNINFLGRIYKFNVSGGYHQLAEMLGKNEEGLIFPATIIINKDLQVVNRLQGFQKAKKLIEITQNK
ncbi:hypothetical protein GCM10011506_45410 [Marivirga lumbricoides]|uniref:Thioredoxin n=1 Tax=Marivirga lumbricoides TaxID=1046115 RepID=A0ABQ1N5H8_9BACT|nr:hypothetical protein GCM10011506_45410 [Marivirga lumbricoides]